MSMTENCDTCGSKVSGTDSTTDASLPDWKKKALTQKLDPMEAPFGGNWKMESSISATNAATLVYSD